MSAEDTGLPEKCDSEYEDKTGVYAKNFLVSLLQDDTGLQEGGRQWFTPHPASGRREGRERGAGQGAGCSACATSDVQFRFHCRGRTGGSPPCFPPGGLIELFQFGRFLFSIIKGPIWGPEN